MEGARNEADQRAAERSCARYIRRILSMPELTDHQSEMDSNQARRGDRCRVASRLLPGVGTSH